MNFDPRESRDGYSLFYYGILLILLLIARDCVEEKAPEICARLCYIHGKAPGTADTNGLFMKCYCSKEAPNVPLDHR
jgi:hypothetical protein